MLRRMMLIVVLLLCAACSDDASTGTLFPPPTSSTSASLPPSSTTTSPAVTTTAESNAPDGAAAWTVLLYIMGDTDLEPFALTDLVEAATAGSSDEVNVVALVDRHPEYSSDGILNLGDWEDTKVLEIGLDTFTEVSGGSELNLGSPDTLANFLTFGISDYPAEHYALILWDHGGGWTGMGPDESDGLDILDLADLRTGLAAGLAPTWVEKLDLIGFDACLMATYEVASSVAPYAEFMLASQELEPGHGWNFESLSALIAQPELTADQLGTTLIDGYADQARELGTDYDITLSLLDLNRLGALQDELMALNDQLDVTTLGTVLATARRDLQGFGRNPDPDLDSNLTDFGALLDNLGASPGVATEAARARQALDAVVVATTAGPATAGASGLSVYFPETEQQFRQGYLFLEGVPAWPDTLSAYFLGGTDRVDSDIARFIDTDENSYYFEDGALQVYGWVPETAVSSVVDATAYFGFYDPDTGIATYFGAENADIGDDGSVATAFDMTYLVLDDGVDTALAFYELYWNWDTATGTMDIPLTYEPATSFDRQDILLSIIYTVDEIVEEDFYAVDESGIYGSLNADPEGLVYPILLEIDADGNQEWIEASDVGLWSDLPYLLYQFPTIEPGTQMIVTLQITDFGGNTDWVDMYPVAP